MTRARSARTLAVPRLAGGPNCQVNTISGHSIPSSDTLAAAT